MDVAYRLVGEGPVTVLVTQGLANASAEWWPIADALAKRARVLTWDRPGYGNSAAPLKPRTAANIAGEALELLAAAAPDGPLILVGHSQGGLYSNALARLVGPRLRGLVLLDPAPPDNARLRRELPPRLFQRSGSDLTGRLRIAGTLARLGIMSALKPVVSKGPPLAYCRQHPPEARDAIWRQLKRPDVYRAALAEYQELEYRTDARDLDALGSFPEVRVVVLVHDPEVMIGQIVRLGHLPREEANRVEALWGQLLRAAATLSPLGTAEAVPGSGHLIHLEAPEVTTATIAGLVEDHGGVVSSP